MRQYQHVLMGPTSVISMGWMKGSPCVICFPTLAYEDFHTSSLSEWKIAMPTNETKKYKRNKLGSRDDKFSLGYVHFEMVKDHP